MTNPPWDGVMRTNPLAAPDGYPAARPQPIGFRPLLDPQESSSSTRAMSRTASAVPRTVPVTLDRPVRAR